MKSAKRNAKFQSYFLVIVILLFNVVQIMNLVELTTTPITPLNVHMVSFAFSFTLFIYYSFIFAYILMFKLPAMGTFMGGKSFRLFGILPLSKKDLENIGIISFLRMNIPEYIVHTHMFH